MPKKYLEMNVYDSAIERLDLVCKDFDRICVSFSGGKDSSVLLHLAMAAAIKHDKLPVHVLFIDLEGQYKVTIEHMEEMLDMYKGKIVTHWVCLPLNMRNAVSSFDPHWCCWEPGVEWVRELPKHDGVVSDQNYYPFYKYRMEFEDFTPAFAKWVAGDEKMACLVGIRSDESLNRFRTIVKERKSRYKNKGWTTRITDNIYNAYPIYDWRVEDVWAYMGKSGLPYNTLYDKMYLAGKSLSEMRICQPYGDDQRKGLNLFHQIEPETWFRVVQRVSGANYGSIYCGNKMLGYHRGMGLPEGHTWESYTKLLLDSMPKKSRDHFSKKFEVFIRWWSEHDYEVIPDESDRKLEASKKAPSWRRLAMCLLKNDFWCKSISFGMTKDLYGKYYRPMDGAIKEKYKDI